MPIKRSYYLIIDRNLEMRVRKSPNRNNGELAIRLNLTFPETSTMLGDIDINIPKMPEPEIEVDESLLEDEDA